MKEINQLNKYVTLLESKNIVLQESVKNLQKENKNLKRFIDNIESVLNDTTSENENSSPCCKGGVKNYTRNSANHPIKNHMNHPMELPVNH